MGLQQQGLPLRQTRDSVTCGVQCSVYIAFDPEMREGPDGEAAVARNSDIVEDLGMVEYCFSDKTGTLTSNEMKLRALGLGGVTYGRAEMRCAHAVACDDR